ncbi:MAG: inositol monophosphatase family protein [Candidatus Woesearchaeota archaeon]
MVNLVDALNGISIKSGRIALDYFGKSVSVSKKVDGSPVSFVDQKIEAIVREDLDGLLKEATFVGEEDCGLRLRDAKKNEVQEAFSSTYLWAIDPLDGTANYLKGHPDWAISLGLLRKTSAGYTPWLGSVFLPMYDTLYYSDGNSSYVVGNVSKDNSSLKRMGLVQVGDEDTLRKGVMSISKSKVGKYQYKNIAEVRVSNCTVCSLMKTAGGSHIGTLTSASIWDVAAGLAIGKPVGLIIYDANNGKEIDGFSATDFIFEDIKRFWKLRRDHFVSSRQARTFLLACLKELGTSY